jgi:hypothetical protein
MAMNIYPIARRPSTMRTAQPQRRHHRSGYPDQQRAADQEHRLVQTGKYAAGCF